MIPRRWTFEEDDALLALSATGAKWQFIAKKLGRTEEATKTRGIILRKSKATPQPTKSRGTNERG